jgi:eukaryotic-like serine/threonine-protein kinase
MMTEAIRKEWVGRVVDSRFRLVEWLGSSGQSGVFLCERDEIPERTAAIKLFPAEAAGARSCAADWAAAATLFHPHLIRVLHTSRDRVDDTAVLYVVTEYAGEVLSDILPVRPLTPGEVKEMLGPIFDALAYLHEMGFVHGRLKPSNIMVVDDQLKLSVENIRGSSAIPKPPQTLEIYDAPESGLGKVTPASDVWALGVTLVEALTRIPPTWNRSSPNEPVVPPSLPKPFAEIAQECLRLDPRLRCTLSEVKACLETGAPIPHRTAKTIASAGKSSKRRTTVIVAAAAVLLAAFAIVMLHTHQSAFATPDLSSPAETPSATEQASVPTSSPAQSSSPVDATPSPSSAAKDSAPSPAPSQPANPQPPPPSQPAAVAVQAPPVQTPPPSPPVHSGPAGKGAVAQQVMPDVPEKAMRTIQGKIQVGIQVSVDPSGAVSGASIASQGPSKFFANLALQAARSWRFTPAQQNGQSVASVWLLHFEFRPSGVDVTPSEKTP